MNSNCHVIKNYDQMNCNSFNNRHGLVCTENCNCPNTFCHFCSFCTCYHPIDHLKLQWACVVLTCLYTCLCMYAQKKLSPYQPQPHPHSAVISQFQYTNANPNLPSSLVNLDADTLVQFSGFNTAQNLVSYHIFVLV